MTADDELRALTADALERILIRGGLDNPWTTRRTASSRWRFARDGVLYSAPRLRRHRQLAADYRAAHPVSPQEDTLVAVVTAGPPGAGKSTALRAMPDLAGYQNVDADDFKDDLLLDARERGFLDPWLGRPLPDGDAVALRELAGFVHAESTAVADELRRQCVAAGEGMIVHGTLSSTDYVTSLLAELDDAGYERLIVVDVEVSLEVATEQALARWWAQRTSGDALGGRFVPASAVRRYFPDPLGTSSTARNARALADRALRLGWDVELRR